MENEYDSTPRKGKVGRPLALMRMLLILVFLGLFIYCLWQGRWLALLAWVLTIAVMIDTSMAVLFGIYNEPRSWWKGFAYWVATLFMGAQATQVVTRKGEIIYAKPAGPLASVFARLGAPGIVIIENGVAVTFERGGRFTRVHKPGVVFIQRHERIAEIVDLRRQTRSKHVPQIMTQDGRSFDLERLDVIFDLAVDFDPKRGEYAFQEEAMTDLIFRGGMLYKKGNAVEWGDIVLERVEFHLRNVAAGHKLGELIGGEDEKANPRRRLLEEVESHAGPALREYGVRLVGIDIGQLIMPQEMRLEHISAGLRKAIASVNDELRKEVGEVHPHLLVNLTEMLGRILQDSLRLGGPAVPAPEVRLLPSAEETPREGAAKP